MAETTNARSRATTRPDLDPVEALRPAAARHRPDDLQQCADATAVGGECGPVAMDASGDITVSYSQGVRSAIAGAAISVLLPLAGMFSSMVAPTDAGQSLSALAIGLILFGVVARALMAAGGVAYDVLHLPRDLRWGSVRYVHPVIALLFPLWVVIYESRKRTRRERSDRD